MQNSRNVKVESLENQPKTHTDKDGFLCHFHLGLVGWISYWCLGDSTLTVIILVTLIKTLGLTELVSDVLGNRNVTELVSDALGNRIGYKEVCTLRG